ncbi:tRNA preQ1(34) S-adenosylmethionine ribosyltransferase-isomerase QueA [Fluviispira multicolorata]|uniref:tRNA preQ1(34) S-adenosylmethionine ribosyltransferase-isomerase QueA n=1 Tax=Fluviispira multicolorata TaxID=2654512 RepID=A0A833JFT4_9BACT|nr:tRNA preQ1(34) S-adenosylmethionine ribosyltransferase-isomerase QueA [Fluviispira multicolorata]KAB8031827.1 tRNA preQ1(34) S-adenosylmethionine ribosyltransferase-isomerase QueA [Fluviispira multicolorata]
MKTSFFNYELPEELIAQVPLEKRDKSRLLVCRSSTKTISDSFFVNIAEEINNIFKIKERDAKVLLVANDSRVYPARVRIRRKTGARGEVFLLERGIKEFYHCLLRPKSKIKQGEILYADQEELLPLFKVTNLSPPCVELVNANSLDELLEKYGEMPLPPYIQRGNKQSYSLKEIDKERYQTVYSNKLEVGSSAAPTAGLHFTPEIIEKCLNNGIDFASVTLHVGLGTFLPVQSINIHEHNMHEEHFIISKNVAEKISMYLANDWPIIFVGTTSLRAVESFFRVAFPKHDKNEIIKKAKENNLNNYLSNYVDKWIATKIFIHPQNENDQVVPCVGNAIITNFHQPESTLAMLISALMGYQFWKEFYAHAINKKYRFFSYGDSSLLVFGENS